MLRRTYAAFEKETFEKVWKYKRYVMKCVKEETKGGNTYMSAIVKFGHSTDTETDVSEPVVCVF